MGAYSPAESARFLLLLFLGADTAPRPHLWFIPLPAGGGTSAFYMVANHTTKYYKLTTSREKDEKHHLRNKNEHIRSRPIRITK